MRRLLIAVVSFLILVGNGIAYATTEAHASPASYIDDLENSPWAFYGDIQTWMAIGYGICHRLEVGFSQSDLIHWVVINTGEGIYGPQAAYVVEAAEVHLCGGGGGRTA